MTIDTDLKAQATTVVEAMNGSRAGRVLTGHRDFWELGGGSSGLVGCTS